MEIVCVGSGSILSNRLSSSFVVDKTILVDVPNGAMKALRRMSISPTQLGIILVTHLHADHFFDAVFLLIENGLRQERREPLVMIGPAGMQKRLSQLFDLSYPESKDRVWANCNLRFIEARDRQSVEVGNYAFVPHQMQHAGMDAFGYLVSNISRAGRVGFSGDTEYCQSVHDLVDSADLAFVDCAFIEPRSGHMGVSEVARLSTACEGVVVGTHVSDEVRSFQERKFELCDDGQVFRVS